MSARDPSPDDAGGRSEFRTVARHTLVYGAGVMLGSLASFLMLPVYTRYLTPRDYGVLELLGMTIDVIGMIAGLGLAAAVFKFHSEARDDDERRVLLSTATLGTLALALVTSLLGMALAGPLARLVFGGAGDPRYFRVFFLIYFFQAAISPAFLLLRAKERSGWFVLVNLAKLILSLALNIYFVVVRRMGVDGVLWSTALVNGVLAAALVAWTLRSVGISFSLSRFRAMARFGAPLVVVSLSSFVLTFSDRYFLNWFASTAAVGVYALAYRFTFALSTLTVVPFGQIWEPRRFEVARRADAGDVYRRMFLYYSMALVGGATLMTAVIHPVLAVMVAPAFRGAARVVPLILAATILQQWAAYACVGLYLRSRTGLLAWTSLASVAATLVLNAVLIPRWGITGAALATLGAYLLRFALTYAFSQAWYPIRYPWGRVSVLGLTFLAVWTVRAMVEPRSLEMSIAFGAILCAATIVVYLQVLTAAERAVIRELIARLRPPVRGEPDPQPEPV